MTSSELNMENHRDVVDKAPSWGVIGFINYVPSNPQALSKGFGISMRGLRALLK